MGKLFTPTTLTDLTSSGQLDILNQMFEDVEAALEDAVSRSGLTPNEMEADLDLGGNDILNAEALGVTPDAYVNAMSFVGTLLTLSRSAGKADLQVDLASLAGANCAFRGALVSRSTSLAHTSGNDLVYNSTEYDTDSIFNGSQSLVIPSGVTRARFAACVTFNDNDAAGVQSEGRIYNASSANFGGGDHFFALNSGNNVSLMFMTGALVVTPGHAWRVTLSRSDASGENLLPNDPGTWFGMEILA